MMLRYRFEFLSLLIAAFVVSLSLAAQAAPKVVTDELVENLRCDSLSPASIYKAINSDAFHDRRTFPIPNFQVPGMSGHCWAIARFDRIALLLGRLQAPIAPVTPAKIEEMARVRGYTKIPYTPFHLKNWSRTPLEVFKWPVITDADAWGHREVDEKSAPHIRGALVQAQSNLFFRSKNLPFILKSNYSVAEKRQQLALAIKLANAKKLPLINIRYTRMAQHIVVVKWIQRVAPGDFYIYTIDSNSTTAMLRIKTSETSFSAVDEASREYDEIEMFTVVEEEDRPLIENALMSYYQRICR